MRMANPICNPRLRRLNLFRLFAARRNGGLALSSAWRRRIVVFPILVIIILGERRIYEVYDDNRDIDLTAVEQFKRFSGEASRSVGETNDKESGVDLWCKARCVIGCEYRRTVDNDVIVVFVNFFDQCVG